MKLTVLGSGTCVPYVKRGSSGYALEVSGSTILLDCGSGTTSKLAKAGINYLGIDHIFLSHIHPDHTGDLVPFLFATRYAHGSPYGTKREKPLTIWGGEGFVSFFEALKSAFNDWIVPETLSVKELGGSEITLDGFKISAVHTPHIESSLAYRIEGDGKSLVYSGDTDYSEELIGLAKDADILVIECSLPDDESKAKGHLSPGEVIEIANKSGARKVVVTHLYPVCDEAGVVDKIRRGVEAQVVEARDLLTIDI